MPLVYSAVFTGVAQTVQQDDFENQPADDKPNIYHGVLITQETEVGDAAEEFITFQNIRGNTTSGSVGGSSPTPRALDRNNSAAAGATVEINNTTKANTGTTHIITNEAANVRTGWAYIPTPELRASASQGDTTHVQARTLNTPADSITFDGVNYFEEN